MNREDLLALAGCAVLVPLTWLGLGWRPDRLVMGYDAVTALLPMVAVLRDAGGDARALAWRDELLGGVAVRDTLGPQPWLSVLAAAGFTATGILNGATFAVQALFAFFGQRLTADLTRVLGGVAAPWWLRVPVTAVLMAFAPFVGWRVGYGHLTLLVGLLPFLACLGVLAASLAATRTAILTLVAAGALASGLPFVGQQTLLYGFVFGAPLLFGLWRCGGGRPRALRGVALVLLSGLLLAAPLYGPMLAHAFGSDALREVGGASVTYSYLTARATDWLTSLPWGRLSLVGRPDIQYHESNLPLGPLLALLALLPRRGRPVLVGIGASLLAAMAFASDLWPVSDVFLWVLPPLRSFRVPTRAVMPALLVLPAVVGAGLAMVGDARPKRAAMAAGLAGGAVLFFMPPVPRELAAWTIVLLALRLRERMPAGALVLALCGCSLAAFRERLLPFPAGEALLAEARESGWAAMEAEPALRQPLTRVAASTDRAPLGANAAFAAGLSSLDGYGFPQRRFVALVRALRGEPYSPNALLLRFHEGYPGSSVLFQLYNVTHALHGDGARPRRRGPTAGAAWFPAGIEVDGTVTDLARALLEGGDATHERARRTLRVVRSDPALAGPIEISAGCAEAAVVALERGGDALRVEVRAAAPCPLVLARNYGTTLTAWDAGSRRALRTFPAYGALLGILVPAGTTRVEVRPRPWPPASGLLAAAAGLVVLAWAVRVRT